MWEHALHLCPSLSMSYGFWIGFCVFVCVCVRVCVVFCCGMLLLVSVHLSSCRPTDYQSILAELQSPAALHSNPYFLDPEVPVTPNPSLTQHQPLHYPEPDSSFQSCSQPQFTVWGPVVDPCSKEPDSPPKSPPRPCELALPVPTFDLPDPLPPKVRKPHIALNDQLLLSEEEDRSFQEMEPTLRPRSQSFPTMCELDIDMAFSTSSPSLSSMSSITPSSPDRACIGVQLGNTLDGVQENVGQKEGQVEVKEEIDKIVEIVSPQLAERNELVEKLVEQELIKNVQRKCEIVAKDRSQLVEEGVILLEPKWSAEQEKDYVIEPHEDVQDGSKTAACEEEKAGSKQDLAMEYISLTETVDKLVKEAAVQPLDVRERIQVKEKMEDPDSELQSQDGKDICDSLKGPPEHQTVSDLSQQACVEELEQLQPNKSGSNEEEEKQTGREIPEDALGFLLKEVNKEGSEEKEDGKDMTETRDQGSLEEVQHAEKNICSLLGWHSDSSSVNVEPPTPGRSVSSDLLDKQER